MISIKNVKNPDENEFKIGDYVTLKEEMNYICVGYKLPYKIRGIDDSKYLFFKGISVITYPSKHFRKLSPEELKTLGINE